MTTPQLSLPNSEIARAFSDLTDNSAQSLASLISRQTSPTSLDAVLNSTIQQLLLSSQAQRAEIDNQVSFLFSVASHLPESVSHTGRTQASTYKTTAQRPSNGPELLVERLSHSLYEKLWEYSSRAVTPDEQMDKELPGTYYAEASVYSTVLARAFAINSAARDRLWRNVEDIFVKGLYSGPDPEPGAFVGLSALLLGAGAEIRAYMETNENFGEGKNWVWYNDAKNSERWGWEDVVKALGDQSRSEILSRLPNSVNTTFNAAIQHIGNGDHVTASWDSGKLATDAFNWVNSG